MLVKKTLAGNKGHYIMKRDRLIKRRYQLLSIYALNIRAFKCVKQILTDMKGVINNNTVK